MDTAVQQMMIADMYADVEKFLFRQAHAVCRRYGWDFEETMADARLAFMLAYHSYSPEKGAFSTWVGEKFKYAVMDKVKKQVLRASHFGRVPLREEMMSYSVPEFRIDEFREELSDSARVVLDTLLRSPKDFLAALRAYEDRPRKPGAGGGRTLEPLRTYLHDTLGWTYSRIADSFREIREAL